MVCLSILYKTSLGYCTSYQKLACFVLHLKIINTFLENNLYIVMFKELENDIETLAGLAVFKFYKSLNGLCPYTSLIVWW